MIDRENDEDAQGWTPEMVAEYNLWLDAQDDERDLPPHKRRDYAEQMACQADDLRKAQREDELLRSVK